VEDLKTRIDILAAEAANKCLESEDTQPDIIIAQISIDKGMNRNEIKRLIERTNQLIQLKMFEKNQLEFPIIKLENVLHFIRNGFSGNSIDDIQSEYVVPDFIKDDWIIENIDWDEVGGGEQESKEDVKKRIVFILKHQGNSDGQVNETPKSIYADYPKQAAELIEHLKVAQSNMYSQNLKQKLKVQEIENLTKQILQKISPKQLKAILYDYIDRQNADFAVKSKAKKFLDKIIAKVSKTAMPKSASDTQLDTKNFEYIAKGLRSQEDKDRLSYKLALSEELEKLGAEKLAYELLKYPNLRYYQDKLLNDIEQTSLVLMQKHAMQKTAEELDVPSIDVREMVNKTFQTLSEFEKYAEIQNDFFYTLNELNEFINFNDEETPLVKEAEKAIVQAVDTFQKNVKKIPIYAGIKGAVSGASVAGLLTGAKSNKELKKRLKDLEIMYEQGKIPSKEEYERKKKEAKRQYSFARLGNLGLGATVGGLLAGSSAAVKAERMVRDLKTGTLPGKDFKKVVGLSPEKAATKIEDDVMKEISKLQGRKVYGSGIIGGTLGAMPGAFIPDYYKKDKNDIT